MRLARLGRRALQQPERLERDDALRRRRQLDDLGPAVGEAERLDPPRREAGQVVLLEPARRGDRAPRPAHGRSRPGRRRRSRRSVAPSSGRRTTSPDARRRAELGRAADALPDRRRPRRDREALLGGVDRVGEARVEPEAPVSRGERRPAGDGARHRHRARARPRRPASSGAAERGRRAGRVERLEPPSRQTSAKQSPPIPVDIGSVTQSTAAAAIAASAAFPPARASAGRHASRAAGSSRPCLARPRRAGGRRRSDSSCERDLGRRAEHAGEARDDRDDAQPRAVRDVVLEPARVQVPRALRGREALLARSQSCPRAGSPLRPSPPGRRRARARSGRRSRRRRSRARLLPPHRERQRRPLPALSPPGPRPRG